MNAYIKLMEKESETDEEKNWLAKNCSDESLLDAMDGMTTLMLHVLDGIARLEPVNGINVSKDLNVPRGSVSKACRKLLNKQLVTAERLSDNKKEVLYRTTKLGYELYILHQKLHEEIENNFRSFLNKYSMKDLLVIEPFLNDLASATFVHLEKKQTPE